MVEDDADFAFLVRRAFEKAKVAVTLEIVGDGERAVSALEGAGTERPALVLLDLKLPKLSGFDVLRWIRGNTALGDLPVVVLTSSGQDRDRDEVKKLGGNDFKVKPPSYSELIDLVREFADRWISSPPRA